MCHWSPGATGLGLYSPVSDQHDHPLESISKSNMLWLLLIQISKEITTRAHKKAKILCSPFSTRKQRRGWFGAAPLMTVMQKKVWRQDPLVACSSWLQPTIDFWPHRDFSKASYINWLLVGFTCVPLFDFSCSNVHFLLNSCGGNVFPGIHEAEVMITIREIVRRFPELGSRLTSP